MKMQFLSKYRRHYLQTDLIAFQSPCRTCVGFDLFKMSFVTGLKPHKVLLSLDGKVRTTYVCTERERERERKQSSNVVNAIIIIYIDFYNFEMFLVAVV